MKCVSCEVYEGMRKDIQHINGAYYATQTLKYSEAEVSKMQADMEAKFEERLRAAEKEWIRKQQGADDARRMKEQETSQLVAQMDEMS
jgi:hypothetical protein